MVRLNQDQIRGIYKGMQEHAPQEAVNWTKRFETVFQVKLADEIGIPAQKKPHIQGAINNKMLDITCEISSGYANALQAEDVFLALQSIAEDIAEALDLKEGFKAAVCRVMRDASEVACDEKKTKQFLESYRSR